MPERKWTRARVLRAYAEWQALSDHALRVYERHDRAYDQAPPDDMRDALNLPGWMGTGWPGTEFEIPSWDSENVYRLPMEYLWTTAWIAKAEAAQAEWRKSHEGMQAATKEFAEYERLRAKYEAEVEA